MRDDATYRAMLKEINIWLHGYCSALHDDAPFGPDYFIAFAAADGALQQRIGQVPDLAAAGAKQDDDEQQKDNDQDDEGNHGA